jgi:sec-independent protein translocase protein TatA
MLSSIILFLNIGTPELMLIMFVALLLFGGEKLPGLARGLGKGIRDFKDASEGVKREINNQINSYEDKKEASTITPHTKVAEEPKSVEAKQLIDTTHIAGTVAIGDSPVVEAAHLPEGHVSESHGLENTTASSGINLTKPEEAANTTH